MKIDCRIRIPEFRDGKINSWKKQSGTFDTETLIFEPNDDIFKWLGINYNVHFENIDQFESARIDTNWKPLKR